MRITLNEGKRDEALGMFLPLFQKRGIETNISQLKQFLLNKFVTEAGMHSLSQGSNYYLLGVARYYFSGELTKNSRLNALYPQFKDKFIPEVCQRLDALVNILRGSYIDSIGTKFEQPEDFGNLSLEALLKKYNRVINKALGLDSKEVTPKEKIEKINQSTKVGKKYTYDILYSFEDAKKYNQYTEPGAWCITYGKQHFEGYIKHYKIHYVIFRQNGFENIPRKKGKNWTKNKPQDEYGNSLIAVLQSNSSPEPVIITSRWNHGSTTDNSLCEADHAYTKNEFFKVTGCDDSVLERAFKQWQEGAKERGQKSSVDRKEIYQKKLNIVREFKYAQMMINGGANLESCVDGGKVIQDAKGYKGIYIVYKYIGDETWCTLMDRKKMFMDQYLINTDYPGHLTSRNSKNFVLLEGPNNNFLVFDKIHHNFLTLDGVYKFAEVNYGIKRNHGDEPKYTMLAASGNQIALLDLRTMKPVRAKNGSCWFECIQPLSSSMVSNTDYRGRIKLPWDVEDNIYRMVYDSAAGESYLFDTAKGEFFETKNEDGFYLAKTQRFTKHGMITYANDKNLVRIQRTDNNEWLKIASYDTFKYFNVDSEGSLIAFKGVDDDLAHFINTKTGKPLMLNGRPVETNSGEMMTSGGWLCISLSRGRNGDMDFWKDCLFFNPVNGTLYHDDINGYCFKVYGSGKVYNKSTNEIYKLPTPEEAANMQVKEKEGITNQFNNMLNRMK